MKEHIFRLNTHLKSVCCINNVSLGFVFKDSVKMSPSIFNVTLFLTFLKELQSVITPNHLELFLLEEFPKRTRSNQHVTTRQTIPVVNIPQLTFQV